MIKSWRAGIGYACVATLLVTTIAIGDTFKVVLSEATLAAAEAKFGKPSRKRLTDWVDLISNDKGKPEQEKLTLVNDFFNTLLFVSDLDHWSVVDYWATPFEMLSTGGGDCEDFAISKYFTLLAVGVSSDKLKITYVKATGHGLQNAAHMVLTYYSSPSAMPVVLDNLIPEMQPADQRSDLVPVYSFNGDGLWLAKQRGEGKAVAGGNKINMWKEMMGRMSKES